MRRALSSLIAVAGVLALAACGPAPSASPQPSEPSGAGPKMGGTLSMSAPVDPFNYDITISKTTPNDDVISMQYSSLLRWKDQVSSYNEMVLEPGLAERWEVSNGGKTFTFRLRPGVKFQDLPPVNGRELTSADIKFTAEYRLRIGDSKPSDKLPKAAEVNYIYEGLDRVETPDPHTAVFHFKDAFVPFLSYAASDWNPIMPREIYDRDGNFENSIVGTGPFMVDDAASQRGTRWVFKKNPTYFRSGLPYLDEVRMLIIPAEATQIAAFQTGQLDITPDTLNGDIAGQVRKTAPDAVEFKYSLPRAAQIYMSQKPELNSPVRDIRVRRAIALTIDRDEINKTLFDGAAEWGMPGMIAGTFTDAEARKHYGKPDVARAKQLLAEAGYPNGITLEWPIPNSEEQQNVTLIELIQAQMKRAGINTELKFMDKAAQRDIRKSYNAEIDIASGLGGLHDDGESLFFARYHSKAKGNYSYVRDREMDRLIEAQRAEPDPEKRRQIMRELSLRALEHVYTIEIVYKPQWAFWHPYVKDYQPRFSNQSPWDFAWLDK